MNTVNLSMSAPTIFQFADRVKISKYYDMANFVSVNGLNIAIYKSQYDIHGIQDNVVREDFVVGSRNCVIRKSKRVLDGQPMFSVRTESGIYLHSQDEKQFLNYLRNYYAIDFPLNENSL